MSEVRRFPIGLTIAAVVAFAILIGLGTWQVQRMAWKRDLIAKIDAARTAPPVPFHPGQAEYARVFANCPGLAKAPFVELYALQDGQAGRRLISACQQPDGRSLLVDRGFVADTISARPPVDAADRTPLSVTGVLRVGAKPNLFDPPDRAEYHMFFSRNANELGAALNAKAPLPLFLMAETPTNPEFKALTPVPLPVEVSNRHLGYVITWYGLAAALAGVYAAMLLRWRKSR